MRPPRQFTLVEMMIVVAVILVLAAIAIPMVANAQLKAKRAEVFDVVDGIATAEVAYEAALDAYFFPMGWAPDAYTTNLDKKATAWPSGEWTTQLAFAPDGEVRGNYYVDAPGDMAGLWGPIPGDTFGATGVTDVDDDGVVFQYGATGDGNFDDITPVTVY
jgi:prepilin-type N-terminal cleavage/methylation domain-containing protein